MINAVRLEGKTIAVTGASSGIGAKTAAAIMAQGGHVIGLDVNEPEGCTFRQFIRVDLSDPLSIEQAVISLSWPIDGLCNVAGLPPTHPAPAVLAVNFTGLRYLTECLVSRMNDGASIVNAGSLAGLEWQANLDQVQAFMTVTRFEDIAGFVAGFAVTNARSYTLSKEALIVWTLKNHGTWARRDIRMNTVSPGPVDTPILQDFVKALGKHDADNFTALRPGTAEEIADVIAFLCSDASRWVRGANWLVDGGLAASELCQTLKL